MLKLFKMNYLNNEHAIYKKSNGDVNFYPRSIMKCFFLDVQSDDDPENSEESCTEDNIENDICDDTA